MFMFMFMFTGCRHGTVTYKAFCKTPLSCTVTAWNFTVKACIFIPVVFKETLDVSSKDTHLKSC